MKYSDYFIFKLLCVFFVQILAPIDCESHKNSSDGQIILDLQNKLTSAHKLVTLQPHSTSELQTINVNSQSSFILFQSHCQKGNVTMMYRQTWSYGSSIHGSSIGLVSYLHVPDTISSVWLNNSNDMDLSCFVAAVPHGPKDPVPGGCNNEFQVSTSPFLHLNFNPVKTTVEYQSSNLGYKRSSSAQISCDLSSNYISYEFYVIFLPEREYGLTEYAHGLTTALSLESLKAKARNIKPYVTTPIKRLFFSSFPGQGVIYTVVSKYTSKINTSDIQYQSPYVPFVTYGCSFSDKVDGCYSINRTFTYVFCICAAIVGVILCVSGHYFLKLEMFVAGFLAVTLLSFILIVKYTEWSYTDRDSITMVSGIIGGFLWLSLWWFFGNPVISLLLVGFEFGFLVSSIVFFTPFGQMELLRNNFNYWMIFSAGVIIIPIILLYFMKLMSIVFCAVIGSFALITAIDRYIRTTLSYIILNIVKRSIDDSLDNVNQVLPFQTNDIILSVAWLVLSIVGIVLQYIITRNESSQFPVAPYQMWKKRKAERQASHRRSRVRPKQLRGSNSENVDDPLISEKADHASRGSYGSVN